MFTPIPNYDKLIMLYENEISGGFTMAKDSLNQCGDLKCEDRELLQNDVSLALEDLDCTVDRLPTSKESSVCFIQKMCKVCAYCSLRIWKEKRYKEEQILLWGKKTKK